MKASILLLLLFTQSLYSQDNNCIEDLKEHEKFQEYLIDLKIQYSKGEDSETSLRKEYENTCIGLRNLKTDSILTDKNLIGIYSFGYASTVDKLYLGLRYPDGKFEYLDMRQSFDKQIEKMNSFLKKCCKEFSLQEKIKTINEATNVLHYYHFGVGCEEVIITYD